MDGPRFDTLTRALATSNRTTRKTFLGAGLGLLLAGRGGDDADANCKKVGQGCNGDNNCCKDAECPRGVCQCKTGFTACNGKCFDLDTNKKHCGACEKSCGRGGTCCSGDCAGDFLTDPDHCGACDNFCRGICGLAGCHGPRCCSDGECVEDVQENEAHCGACVDLFIDPANCGTCGHTCGEFDPNCVGFCTGDARCPAGADPCAEDGGIPCDGDCACTAIGCVCSQSTEGGTLCGDPTTPGADCGQCQNTTDCVSLFGPGHFCTKADCCGRGAGKVCRQVCTD